MTGLAPAIAAHGLPSRHELLPASLSDAAFGDLLRTCEHERLLGLLGVAVGSDALPVTEEQRAQVEEKVASWSAHALRVERTVLRVLDLLTAADIPSRVLGGVALAHTVYRTPELRGIGHLRLLVRDVDDERALEIVRAGLDADQPQPELRHGFAEGTSGLTPELGDLFAPPYRFPLADYELEVLPMPQRLLHACCAAAVGDRPPRLMSLRDVVELVLVEQPNLVDVLLMARAWRCEVVVAHAVTTAWRELAVVPRPALVEWAHRNQPTPRDRVLLTAHEDVARASTRHLAAAPVLSSTGERPASLRAGGPSPRYCRAPHVLWRRTLDTVVLLPVASDDEPFALGGSGPELWKLLADPRTLDDLVAVVHDDVEPMLEHLAALGVIEPI